MFAGKKVLVTGGAGFIGSHLVDALIQTGAYVRVLDNLETGTLENLQDALQSAYCEFQHGDVRSMEDCTRACSEIDIVFHEAALVSVPISVADPRKNHDINLTGVLNILTAAGNAGVRRFVYATSASVYGSIEKLPKEEHDPRDYTSPYALSKGVLEDYATLWASDDKLGHGMTCVGLRYFNVYGPRQNPESPYSGVISKFLAKLQQNEPITIFGTGEQTRDYVYVADVVVANLLAATKPLLRPSRVFNVGTGESISLLTLKECMEAEWGTSVGTEFRETRAGDFMHSRASLQKIQNELGYSPQYPLSLGLKYLTQTTRGGM